MVMGRDLNIGYFTLQHCFDSVTCISVVREQLGKHVPTKKNSWPTIGEGLSIVRQRAVNNLQLNVLQQYQTPIARQLAVNKFLQ
jgi:hypothetical protein